MKHIGVIEMPHSSSQGAVYTLLSKVNEIVAWINEHDAPIPISRTGEALASCCTDAITPALTMNAPAWISVKDRLPEEGVPVLVTGVVKKGDHPYLVDYIYKDDWFWWPMNYNRTRGFVITHWMPLPAPPEAV